MAMGNSVHALTSVDFNWSLL